MRDRPALRLPTLLFLGLLVTACSDSGGGGASADFQLTRISLLDDAVWKLNQEIVFTFSDSVDPTSISLNTINIKTAAGAPATGTFFLRTSQQVVFQPNCPLQSDLSDAGFKAGQAYEITVLGANSASTVRSLGGASLAVTQVRGFTTPNSTNPNVAYVDTRPDGAPEPVLRSDEPDDDELVGTYLEIGGDPDDRVYFERDPVTQDPVLSRPGFESPLNLYSLPVSQIAIVIEFNQAVDPAATNISPSLIQLESSEGTLGPWLPIETKVSLVANCTETGAHVRLEPVGVLPPASFLRAVVRTGFQDLVGQRVAQDITNFALVPTVPVEFSAPLTDGVLSDELPEDFDFGGDSPESLEDTQALFGSPIAEWGGGRLSAAFTFEGSGGPGGAFDWVLENGDRLVFDTTGQAILGADGVTIQNTVGGVVDVRDLRIEAGAELRVQGPNPLRINATGEVVIRGILDVSGFDAADVVRVNSGDLIEFGAAGGPGGGRGGNANEVITSSTAKGSPGQGPLGQVNNGGQGGDACFAAASKGKDARRPGGGGGGRFAAGGAQSGTNGSSLGQPPSGVSPPLGGAAGIGAFSSGGAVDDFFGTRPEVDGFGDIIGLIRGELPSLWAGYGGGGGGNADPASAFPTPNWTPASDEKGGAGGGGGGGLQIRALGRILFGAAGRILCNGGRGALGENTLGQDHVGGSGGSGSGGHVILETASWVDFTDEGLSSNLSREWISAVGGPQIKGPVTTGGDVSYGGAGGPGVIQLHVPDTLLAPGASSDFADIVLPTPALNAPDPIDAVMSPAGIVAIPAFGARSLAQSKWISIGRADQKPGGTLGLVQFLFGGIHPIDDDDEGKVLVDGGTVAPLAPLVDDDIGASVEILDGATLGLSGGALDQLLNGLTDTISNDLYLRNPALLESFLVRLEVPLAIPEPVLQDFAVASAEYLEGGSGAGDEELRLTVADEDNGDLADFVAANPGATIHFQLIPRFFRVVTGGIPDSLPEGSYVRIRFQAAADDGSGNPDESTPLLDWTGNIFEFNGLAPGLLQFFRFEVEFELDAQSVGVSGGTEPITLDFLRVPFVF